MTQADRAEAFTNESWEPPSVAELYHENSKQRRGDSTMGRRIAMVNANPELQSLMANTCKSYPGAEKVTLPLREGGELTPVEAAVATRRSVRSYRGTALSLAQLARLLRFSAGQTGRLLSADGSLVVPVRATPSAGALYPVELYPLVIGVDGLAEGVYHYAAASDVLEVVTRTPVLARLTAATGDIADLAGAAVCVVLTVVFRRSSFKYGERAYRFAMLEAGHIAQNFALVAQALDLGSVAIGGFVDDEVNDLLGVDGTDEAAVYVLVAGVPARGPSMVGSILEMLHRPGGPV